MNHTFNATGHVEITFNDEGAVYGPNGELELDRDLQACDNRKLTVFATCKNNCPGGELFIREGII